MKALRRLGRWLYTNRVILLVVATLAALWAFRRGRLRLAVERWRTVRAQQRTHAEITAAADERDAEQQLRDRSASERASAAKERAKAAKGRADESAKVDASIAEVIGNDAPEGPAGEALEELRRRRAARKVGP